MLTQSDRTRAFPFKVDFKSLMYRLRREWWSRKSKGLGEGKHHSSHIFRPSVGKICAKSEKGEKTTDRNLTVINSKFAVNSSGRVKNSYGFDSSYVNLQLSCFNITLYFFK